MKYRAEDIFTPQGLLEEVAHNPNMDFLMNLFQIPRAFGVSGFGGGWNVGMHSVATAFLAMYWAKFHKFDENKRNKLVTLALVHDLHEAVTGDILPMFKAKSVKEELEKIQNAILKSLQIEESDELSVDLKVLDLIAFLYEIEQVSPSILSPRKLKLAHTIAEKQRSILFEYCREKGIKKQTINKFLLLLEI